MNSTTYRNNYFLLFFILLIAVYYSQGVFYPIGSPVSISCLVIWILIDTYYLLLWVSDHRNKDIIGIIIFVFWLFNFIYWFISEKTVYGSAGVSVSTTDQFKNCTIALLAYYPICYWTKHGGIKTSILGIFCIMITGISVLSYYSSLSRLLSQSKDDMVTMNAGYMFVSIFPLVCLAMFKKKWIYFFILVLLFFSLSSAKRGAILCVFYQIILLFSYKFRELYKSRNGLVNLVGLLIAIAVIIYFGYNMYLQNDYLLYRLEMMGMGKDASSDQRMYGYLTIFNTFQSSNFLHVLFGYGFNQSVALTGAYAHSDWLEVLINQGLIGFIMYFIFVIVMIIYPIRSFKYLSNELKCAFFCIIGVWLIRSMMSMCYLSSETFMLVMALAYIEGEIWKGRLVHIKQRRIQMYHRMKEL